MNGGLRGGDCPALSKLGSQDLRRRGSRAAPGFRPGPMGSVRGPHEQSRAHDGRGKGLDQRVRHSVPASNNLTAACCCFLGLHTAVHHTVLSGTSTERERKDMGLSDRPGEPQGCPRAYPPLKTAEPRIGGVARATRVCRGPCRHCRVPDAMEPQNAASPAPSGPPGSRADGGPGGDPVRPRPSSSPGRRRWQSPRDAAERGKLPDVHNLEEQRLRRRGGLGALFVVQHKSCRVRGVVVLGAGIAVLVSADGVLDREARIRRPPRGNRDRHMEEAA